MSATFRHFHLHGVLNGTDETRCLAETLGHLLKTGDCLTLSGDLGAGKSTFARTFIQFRADAMIDVPSPSFTLVQSYELPDGAVLHADLYRIQDEADIDELGLSEALEDGICLIEWPDRLPNDAFPQRISLDLQHILDDQRDDQRRFVLTIPDTRLTEFTPLLAIFSPEPENTHRADARAHVLQASAWADADGQLLPNDMSLRRYVRFTARHDHLPNVMLMDAPPDAGEDIRPFIDIAAQLHALGLSAPRLYHADPAAGYLLCEDLGHAQYSRLLQGKTVDLPYLEAAMDVLVHLSTQPPAASLAAYDHNERAREAMLFVDWYLPWATGEDTDASERESFGRAIDAIVQPLTTDTCLVLRDYHVDNLIWLDDRQGLARVGLLDFQDALNGAKAYDVVSLIEDARRDMPEDQAHHLLEYYLANAQISDKMLFLREYEALALQRHLKVLGIFTRYAMRTNIDSYLIHLDRLWRYVMRRANDPNFSALFAWLDAHCPARLRRQSLR